MTHEPKNGLAAARSAYLRSAMHQPVQWNEWGLPAFERAQREDKPILLDIGAVWCHWCHVMDRESYEDPATAEIVNEHFIAIKVDRDERPDVDARYQAAVGAISGQGGWPLTAFLTPEGKPYFGGTYFPPQDQHGRPGLPRVLLTMAEAFLRQRGEVEESAASVMTAIEHNESFDGPRPGLDAHFGSQLVDKLVAGTLSLFDRRAGGFGTQPKFPHSGAIDLLIDVAGRRSGDPHIAESARLAATVTLRKMAHGGIYDHLAGGFHRYSVDERWAVPHFEKMAYDNALLLANCVHAFQAFGEPEFARVARDILRWMDECLSDRERGGFHASQDADVSPGDDGDYYTWTRAEAAAVLTREEFAVAAAYFDLREVGDMRHHPQKNVLHVHRSIAEVARDARRTLDEVEMLLASARRKLYAARTLRPTPFVDRTVYAGWNGLCISAYLAAGRALEEPAATAFALRSLDRLLEAAWDGGRLGHVVAYTHGAAGTADAGPVAGVLDDYVFTGHAALDAWEATGELRYFEAASAIAETLLAQFADPADGGFFDTASPPPGQVPLGALVARRKPLQDSPTPAGNPVAASLLFRLYALTGREDHAAAARSTLARFAGLVEHLGLYAASYGLALQRMVQPSVQVWIVGGDARAQALEAAAHRRYAVNRSVVRLRRDQLTALPPALAQTLPHLPVVEGSFAVVCAGFTCQPPVNDPERLTELLASA